MHIHVKVATILLKRADPPLAKRDFDCDCPDGTNIRALIDMLGIPADLVWSVTVNSRRSKIDRVIMPGDTVIIIPAISGG
ncbi:MAG TPA: MoaD/ThiS family protein [Candidatus Anoxymicrobiaceae bacterium]|jgi:molybdopterin converting factor small subunit